MHLGRYGPLFMIIIILLCGSCYIGIGSDVEGRAAPVITGVTVTNINETSATVSWVTDINGTSEVYYRTENASIIEQGESVKDMAFTADHSVNLTGLVPSTTYYFVAFSNSETSENTSSDVHEFRTADPPLPVNQPPEISDVKAVNITDSAATIKWSTNELTKGTIYYGTSEMDLGEQTSEDVFSESHSLTLGSLSPETPYYFKITVVDSDEAATESGVFNFTTNSTPGGGTPDTELSGSVEDEDGEPMEGAKVVVVGTEFNTSTDEDGKFSIKGLPPGDYTVNISSGEHIPREFSVTVTEGEEASLEATLQIDPDRDGDGLPNEWEQKYGMDPDDPGDAQDDLDDDGFTNLEEFEEGTDPTDDRDIPLEFPVNLESYGFNLLEMSVDISKDEKSNDINGLTITFIYELRDPQDFRKEFLDEGPKALGLEGDGDGEVTGKEVQAFEDEFADVLEKGDDLEAPVLFENSGPEDNPDIEVELDHAEDDVGSGDDIGLTIRATYSYELEGAKSYGVKFDIVMDDVPEDSFALSLPDDWEIDLDTLDPDDLVDHFSKGGTDIEEDVLDEMKTRDIAKMSFQIRSTQRERDESPGFEALVLLASLAVLLMLFGRRREI